VIIDGHCHHGRGDPLVPAWIRAPLGVYLRRARAAGIDRTVLIAPLGTDYGRVNAANARIAARHPGRFLFFASIDANRHAGRVRDLIGQAVDQGGCRGIKVHRMDAPATREVCRAAEAYRLPVLYDVMGAAELLDVVATDYPTVTFIAPHLGSFGDDRRAHLAVIDQLVRLPNVYADTSGVRRFDYLVEAVRRAGPRKIIFGTDGPYLHPGLELEKIRLLGLPAHEEALILGGNLVRILGQSGRARDRLAVRDGALASGRRRAS
jgi:predicted TIM-barrel fold metal-dependent hydrolase